MQKRRTSERAGHEPGKRGWPRWRLRDAVGMFLEDEQS
jgi:hypothetical protein